MRAVFSAFEMMVEEALARGGEWLFEHEEIEQISEVQRELKAGSAQDAIKALKNFLEEYFKDRHSPPIIEISVNPNRIRIVSNDSAKFIKAAMRVRNNQRNAKEFENIISDELSKKLTGEVINIGYPRKDKKVRIFKDKLKELGIDVSILRKKVKDGGLDILWVLPLGKRSEIPFVNFQCKNKDIPGKDVDASVIEARRTFARHTYFKNPELMPIFVVMNTYLCEEIVAGSSGQGYVYLGLTEILSHSGRELLTTTL